MISYLGAIYKICERKMAANLLKGVF